MSLKPSVASIVGKTISGVFYINVDGNHRHSLILTFDDDTHLEFYSYAHIHGVSGTFPGGYESLLEEHRYDSPVMVEFLSPPPPAASKVPD